MALLTKFLFRAPQVFSNFTNYMSCVSIIFQYYVIHRSTTTSKFPPSKETSLPLEF